MRAGQMSVTWKRRVAGQRAAVFETRNFGDIMHAVQRSRVGVTRITGEASLDSGDTAGQRTKTQVDRIAKGASYRNDDG
ncbi:hypothetical protein ABH945_006523 [Paraburkholderia sp. GAS333]